MSNIRSLLLTIAGMQGDANDRMEILGKIVLDLLVEVEALRSAVIELSNRSEPAKTSDHILDDDGLGLTRERSVYEDAYLNTSWLTHFAAGPSSGIEKLLGHFYSNDLRDNWRECIMLKRLGLSNQEIDQYKQSASRAELCT